jgi:putative DNA primase/helicase
MGIQQLISLYPSDGDRLRLVSRWGRWIVWKGHTWHLDDRNVAVAELAKGVSRALYLQASKTADTSMAANIAKLAKTTASRSGISAMIELARGIPGVPVLHNAPDTDPWLLGVRNGVIDLRTGQRRDGEPEDLMIMQASASYDPDARCPTWDKCLREWFPNEEVRHYVQRVAGQAIVGEQ